MPNSDRVNSLLALLSEFNNRSRWYSSRIWQIPFAYIGLTGILATLSLRETPLDDSISFFVQLLFIVYGVIGILVFIHMLGVIDGEKRAIENLQKIENDLFSKVLKNTPNLEIAKYKPVFYVWPLVLVVLLVAVCYLIVGFSGLGISKALMVISYLCIILGSTGMIIYFVDFPFSTSLADVMSVKGYHIPIKSFFWWFGSWLLIIVGTTIQLLNYLRAV